ncbi:hypothetical protein PQX77_008697, partial [Marasmius sp. AFHP31]
TSPEPITAFGRRYLRQLRQVTGCWLNASCQGRLGRSGSSNQSSLQFQFVLSDRQLFYGAYPNRTPPPTPRPTSSEQSIHAGTRNRPKRSHPLDESPQPLSYELTIPTRGIQLKDPETGLPILIHILAASQHGKRRAALPSSMELLPVPPRARTLRRAAIVRFGAGAEVSVG